MKAVEVASCNHVTTYTSKVNRRENVVIRQPQLTNSDSVVTRDSKLEITIADISFSQKKNYCCCW